MACPLCSGRPASEVGPVLRAIHARHALPRRLSPFVRLALAGSLIPKEFTYR